jgi:hypothetical protein
VPILVVGAAVSCGVFASPVSAATDGAEWETAADPQGCRSCHLDSPDPPDSDGLSIEGLPAQVQAGQRYELTIALEDPELQNAGFLLTVSAQAGPAGTLAASDALTATNGAMARSTYDGTEPDAPGKASWELVWTAPAVIEEPLRFDLWANAGNWDLSPLGDRVHHRVWRVPEP